MKKFIAAALLTACCIVPAARAGEPARDRAADAQDVTAMLGLGQDVRVLSATEANEIRATGGCYSGSLLNLNAVVKANVNVNVKAAVNSIVKVVSGVKVNANVGVGIKIK